MDPFTERMLARSRARRERQESQNPDFNRIAELECPKQRNPLQDQKQMQLLKVTTEVEVAVTKSGKEQVSSSVKITPKKCDPIINTEESEDVAKENVEMSKPESKQDNTSAMRDSARSRLRRLGALYADSQLSSPIHQTEGSFSAEQDGKDNLVQQPYHKSGKTGTRLARLAVLADTIKHWEDDLSHPTLSKSSPDKLHKIEDEHFSDNEEERVDLFQDEHEKLTQDVTKTKQEAQGYMRTRSNSRLVYDYSKNSSQDDNKEDAAMAAVSSNELTVIREREGSVNKEPENSDSVKGTNLSNASGDINNLRSISSSKLCTSPEKRITSVISNGSPRTTGVPQMGLRVRSPHRGDASPKTGSVLHKAALFESNSPTRKNGKDPTELSVSERLALFERNKGQALIPKAAFSMPVPAKYLDNKGDNKNRTNSPSKINTKSVGGIINQLQKGIDEKPKIEFSSKSSPGKPLGKVEFSSKSSPGKPLGKDVENTITQMQKSAVADIPVYSNDVPLSLSRTLAQMFEQGNVITADKSIVQNAQSERQKEMKMLLNRWNKNKEISTEETNINLQREEKKNQSESSEKQESMGPPHPPPMPGVPDLSEHHFNVRSQSRLPQTFSSSPNKSPLNNHSAPKSSSLSVSPEKRYKVQTVDQHYVGLTDIKKVKVSPPKPGRLYPCLSDIEATTETESELQDDYNQSLSDMDSSEANMNNTSFGREILEAAGIHGSPKQGQKQTQADSSDDESDMESAVLEEIDDFLDEALGDDSDSEVSPSPPKRTKDASRSPQRIYPDKGRKKSYCSPTSAQSHSFKYSRGQTYGEVDNDSSTESENHIPSYVVEGREEIPLMHTVSFYRRQQNLAVKGTPVRQIMRHIDIEQEKSSSLQTKLYDSSRKERRIAQLVDEASKQLTVISQATQALNLCSATVEFSGSAEEVEGERLLLLASHRRQAALDEIQQLQMEATLKQPSNDLEPTERGSLLITNITLPIKKEYLRALAAAEQYHHFVCLVRAQEQVMATPVVAASNENLRRCGGASLQFPGSLKLEGLCSNFRAKLEIYSLQTQREMLPHDIKYHIAGKKDGNSNKLRLTPKKLLKQESRLIMPTIQSPAGPSAVRAPAFQMCGFVVFSLREVKRTQFTLNNVAYSSPLAGTIQLKLNSELELDVGERGFLTMFEDVSGFGAWHRRWCLLEGATLSYWKYPDDEKKKVPIGQIDLNICTTDSVGLVSRDICARPHTFLLETTRPSQPNDEESLVLIQCGSRTTIRHLLSADTREDRIAWCTQINKALTMLRMWGNKSSHY